jgi:hypothetical protein
VLTELETLKGIEATEDPSSIETKRYWEVLLASVFKQYVSTSECVSRRLTLYSSPLSLTGLLSRKPGQMGSISFYERSAGSLASSSTWEGHHHGLVFSVAPPLTLGGEPVHWRPLASWSTTSNCVRARALPQRVHHTADLVLSGRFQQARRTGSFI